MLRSGSLPHVCSVDQACWTGEVSLVDTGQQLSRCTFSSYFWEPEIRFYSHQQTDNQGTKQVAKSILHRDRKTLTATTDGKSHLATVSEA